MKYTCTICHEKAAKCMLAGWNVAYIIIISIHSLNTTTNQNVYIFTPVAITICILCISIIIILLVFAATQRNMYTLLENQFPFHSIQLLDFPFLFASKILLF